MWTRNDFARLLHVRRFPVSLLYVSVALLLNFKNVNWRARGRDQHPLGVQHLLSKIISTFNHNLQVPVVVERAHFRLTHPQNRENRYFVPPQPHWGCFHTFLVVTLTFCTASPSHQPSISSSTETVHVPFFPVQTFSHRAPISCSRRIPIFQTSHRLSLPCPFATPSGSASPQAYCFSFPAAFRLCERLLP